MATKEQINSLKNELLTLKEQLEQRVENDHETVLEKSEKESVGELSSYDNHPGDLGTELFEIEREKALDSHAETEIEKVNAALSAISEGTYGICKTCGTEIPYERLEAVPSTLYCVEHTPEQHTASDRPVEEDLLIPSKGDSFENRHRGNANEKEDSFGEVARFGTSETPSDFTGDNENFDSLYKEEDETNGFTEEYEGFLGNDIEGKNKKVYPTKREEKYEQRLDDENMESQLGDIPYKRKDSYVDEK
ncbi:TraR/DksA C4-type zinc finger protein [Actinomycetes bacterium NPDC127524]